MNIDRFEDIKSWRLARRVTNGIYDASDVGRFAQDRDLKSQIRRSCISIMSNIAEGFERQGNREFINFLSIAKGSCAEAKSQAYIAKDRKYISSSEFQSFRSQFDEIGRLIGGFINYLRNSGIRGNKFKE
jgi:four helix bundle protein